MYELVQLLWQLLSWDSASRPTAEQALQSRFFQIDSSEYLKEGVSLRNYQSQPKGTTVRQQAERSCESLSMFLQMRNQPANLHSTPVMTPLDVIKSSNDLPISAHHRHNSLLADPVQTKRKHKRNMTTPLTLAETAVVMSSPLEMSFFSPTLTSSNEVDNGSLPNRRILKPPLVNARETPIETPLKLPFKKLTAEDYMTPPPVCKPKLITSHSILSKRPKAESGQNADQIKSQILHPPSFDEIVTNPGVDHSTEATHPFQIPFTITP